MIWPIIYFIIILLVPFDSLNEMEFPVIIVIFFILSGNGALTGNLEVVLVTDGRSYTTAGVTHSSSSKTSKYSFKRTSEGKSMVFLKENTNEEEIRHNLKERHQSESALNAIHRDIVTKDVNNTKILLYKGRRSPAFNRNPKNEENVQKGIYRTRKRKKQLWKQYKNHLLGRDKRDITEVPLEGFGSFPQLWTLLPRTTPGSPWGKGVDIGMAPVQFTSEEPTLVPHNSLNEINVIIAPMETNIGKFGRHIKLQRMLTYYQNQQKVFTRDEGREDEKG